MAGSFPSPFSPSPMAPLERLSSSPAGAIQHEVLLITAEPGAAEFGAALRQTCRVVSTAHGDVARQYLEKGAPSLVIADADVLPDAAGTVRAAKALPLPATVLVTTTDVNTAPALIEAGCDAVLLKPFAPNLLYARVGRLLRARTEQQRLGTRKDQTQSRFASPNGHNGHNGHNGYNGDDGGLPTTNRFWADMACPRCHHDGAVSFEFASHRRAWYACLECKSVWMAKRRE